MLEKIADCIRVDKLRAILLMEADFNFGTKLVFGSKMVTNMERSGLIPPEVKGGRKGMQAKEVAICGGLLYDISRQ